MGHVFFHDFCWVMPLQNQPFLEGGIETPVVGVREPDEVGRAVVGVVAVQMMTLVLTSELVHATRTDPSDSHKDVAVRCSDEVAHPRVVGMDVWFGMEVLGLVVMNFVESSG